MSEPKFHHFVPKMLLKRFVDERGKLHIFRKSGTGGAAFSSVPQSAFGEGYLYARVKQDGTKDLSLEKSYSTLEGVADSIIEKIVSHASKGLPAPLSDNDISNLHLFIYMQWKRVPDLQNFLKPDAEISREIDEKLNEILEIEPHREEEVDALRTPEAKKRLIKNIRVDVCGREGPEVLDVLSLRGISIIKIGVPNKKFAIGSRPVVKLTVGGKSDLSDPQVELWLPVGSDLAIGAGDGPGSVKLHTLKTPGPIRQLNLAVAKQSSMFAAACPRLVSSLAFPR